MTAAALTGAAMIGVELGTIALCLRDYLRAWHGLRCLCCQTTALLSARERGDG